jgi:lysophospholipase L1-like esterase
MAAVFLALGDESVLGLGASSARSGFVGRIHERLQRVLPGIGLEKLAAPGMMATDLVARVRARGPEPAPLVVTVAIGASDVLAGTPPERFQADVDALVGLLAATAPLVVVHLLPDLALTPRLRRTRRSRAVRARVDAFNDILRAAGRRHGAAIADLDLWSHAAYDDPLLYAADGQNLSDEGHAVWAQLTWPAFERRLG